MLAIQQKSGGCLASGAFAFVGFSVRLSDINDSIQITLSLFFFSFISWFRIVEVSV